MIPFAIVAALAIPGLSSPLSLSVATPQAPADVPRPTRYFDVLFPELDVTEDIVYAKALNEPMQRVELLELDMYEPRGDLANARWAIVMVHGGSFSSGDKAERWAVYAREYASRGYVAVSINYRLALNDTSELQDPDLLQTAVEYGASDTRAAVRWLRANAASLRIDPERIAAIGSSAGAYSVLSATYGDFTHSSNPTLPGFDGRPTASAEISGALLEPLVIEPGEPAVLIIHGLDDQTVPIGSALQVAKACNTLDIFHEDVFVSGAGHGLVSSHQALVLERSVHYFREQLRMGGGF
jgi:pimeloyl-ACP methyl ester carboxylesterase